MDIYLVRHTAPRIAAGICYGRSDVDVAQSFAADLEQVRGKLAHVVTAHIYSSPLQRCSKLAQALSLGAVTHDARLQELHFGDWELQPWNAIPRDALDRWGNAYVDEAPPAGESFADLHRRAVAFLDEVKTGADTTVVVTHGGVIRALLAEAMRVPLADAFRLQVNYSSVTQLRLEGNKVQVGYVNQ